MESAKDGETVTGAEVPEGDVALSGLMEWRGLPHQIAVQSGRYDLGDQGFGEGLTGITGYFESGASDGLPQTHPDQSVAIHPPDQQ